MKANRVIIGTSAATIAVYHSLIKMSQSMDTFKAEKTIAATPIVLGGLGLSSINFDTATNKQVLLSGTMFFSGISYVFLRSYMKSNPRKAAFVSLLIGFSTSLAISKLRKNEKFKSLFNIESSGKALDYEHQIQYDEKGKIKKITSTQKK